MPVVPLDHIGPPDPNATKTTEDLIAEAEKNRPEVAQDQSHADVAEAALKAINNELLPNAQHVWTIAGRGHRRPAES